MLNFMIKCFINMIGIYIATLLFPAIFISGLEGVFWAGFLLGLLNLFLRPLLLLISLPINLVTLGLFTLIINAFLVVLTDFFVRGLTLPTFSLAFATAFITTLLHMLSSPMLRKYS